MSFNRVTLSFFQRWEKLVLELGPRVTCLTGRSGAGKSSVVRALRWICLNEPSGQGLTNWEADEVKARLFFDDEHIVSRRRGSAEKGGNRYVLDGDTFASVGVGKVPEPIANLLRVGPDNFQRQLDPHFWLSLSPTQVARELNRIVDLDVIDTTLANVATRSRKANASLDVCRERVEKAKERVEALDWVEAFAAAVLRVEQTGEGLEKARVSLRRLGVGLEKARECYRVLDAARKALPALEAAVEAAEVYQTALEVRDRLGGLLRRARKAASDAKVKIPDTSELDDIVIRMADAEWKRSRLEALLRRAREAEKVKCESERALRAGEKEVKDLLKNGCPICGSPMKTK